MGGGGVGGGGGVLENEQGRTKGRGVKTQESWADVLFEYSLSKIRTRWGVPWDEKNDVNF